MTATKTETKTNKFILTITLGNDVLKGSGLTVLEALQSIKKPVKIFTKGHIGLSHAGKSMEKTWQPVKVKMLFQKIAQPILSKQLEYLLR